MALNLYPHHEQQDGRQQGQKVSYQAHVQVQYQSRMDLPSRPICKSVWIETVADWYAHGPAKG